MTDPTNDALLVPDPSFMDDYDFGGSFTPPPQAKEPDPKRPGKMRYRTFLMQAPTLSDILTRQDEQGNPIKPGGGTAGRFLRTKTQQPSLKAILLNVKLVESGYEVGQTHLSAAQFNKYGKDGQPTGEKRNASQAIEYFHAHGIDARPATPDDYETFFQATADREFEGRIQWSAYDKDTQSDVASKYEDFPDDPENPGQKLPYVEKNGKRFWARASVQGFVSKVERPKK